MTNAVPPSDDVRLYEVCLLYPYPMNQKEEAELLSGIDELFNDAGATVVLKDAWGRRGLAYPIKGSTEANILIAYYHMQPEKLKEIDTQLRIMKGVLRHMIIKPPNGYQVVPFANRFNKWQEEQRMQTEKDRVEVEEKLRRRVVEKSKKPMGKVPERTEKKAEPAKPVIQEQLSKQLDRLVSDADITL